MVAFMTGLIPALSWAIGTVCLQPDMSVDIEGAKPRQAVRSTASKTAGVP